MAFEEYWDEVTKLKNIPNTAIEQLPSTLSEKTKKKLMKRKPEESAEILEAAIDLINRGSVESIDSLIRKLI